MPFVISLKTTAHNFFYFKIKLVENDTQKTFYVKDTESKLM